MVLCWPEPGGRPVDEPPQRAGLQRRGPRRVAGADGVGGERHGAGADHRDEVAERHAAG